MLGAEVGQPPRPRTDDREVATVSERRAIRQNELNVLPARARRNLLIACKRMVRRSDGDHRNAAYRCCFEAVDTARERTGHADDRGPRKHVPGNGPECFDMQA